MENSPGGGPDLARYHASRSIEHQPFRSACYAPFVGLSFDMTGAVSVCAFTRMTPLGWVGTTPLREMWDGHRAQELRDAVRADDLSVACFRCAEEIEGGNLRSNLASGFDGFVASTAPEWPLRMEFALSTACNLQCVMCSGEFSSAIRARREGLPPLRQPYGEEFLDELDQFLPHLEQARFLGGEPFLADINFRIWDRMIEMGLETECNVTTNGTVWTRRMERVLERLPFSVGISLDGVTRGTVESIRAGADHDVMMANLAQFVQYRDRRGTSLSLTFCLMVDNVREFVDFLVMGEELGCPVYVNTVRQPPNHSLYHLPNEDLERVLVGLEEDAARVGDRVGANGTVLGEQMERLRTHYLQRVGSEITFGFGPRDRGRFLEMAEEISVGGRDEDELLRRLRSASLDGSVSVVRCDSADRIVAGEEYLGVPVRPMVGRKVGEVFPMLAERFGHRVDVMASVTGGGVSVRVVTFEGSSGSAMAMVAVTRRGPEPDVTSRFATLVHLSEDPTTTEVPIRIGAPRRRASPIRRLAR